ncbi:biotin synthase [Campylobacter fetus]|nr:biotin synthetase [Campylobacter fetus subsp. venerealis cfvi03/293]AIR79848.1 biotin synthetase [Campylobacter fetus subsp. venerealis 97/608]EAI3887287.1 biotin synthase [Campylobacter fetus]EGU23355.1 Biotin synthase [Campylobacter fetus subsp. venerealis NCTC 10354]KAA3686072.1 biotin synthase [Campylobacter fetus subsp. fetus]KAA3686965.1 biotin synthase [Campylobacter fetus subsp. venerealis]OCS19758.1 biotin synthase [Campylobacter fetus subsp. venerealis cfvi03/596]OCS21667.1 biot
MSKMVMLCAICNVSSGNCAEDCAYCTQSAHIKADIPKFKQKNLEQILNEAKIASKNYALGFCLVTSGLGLDDKKLEFICEAATMLRKETPNLMLIACNGSASYESLKELKKVGIFSYNHNLETSREFFPQICTTHSWDDRFNTNLNAKKAGLELCCGGIYGLGESQDDRLSFRASLKELNPFSSPINFFIPNPALKIKQPLLSTDEALEIIRDTAKTLPQCRIMVAGGREIVLGDRQYEILENGASAIVIGDYLTTSGEVASKDIEELRNRGFEFASQCH